MVLKKSFEGIKGIVPLILYRGESMLREVKSQVLRCKRFYRQGQTSKCKFLRSNEAHIFNKRHGISLTKGSSNS